ncbi:MAG: hypothetical protein KAI47_20855 [Deltaproteobacteria bacterium]|nr:hypothetical protein [Deltaproteobacteria bacterium]
MTKQFTLRLREETHQSLKALSDHLGPSVTMNDIVQEAVEQMLVHLARDLGAQLKKTLMMLRDYDMSDEALSRDVAAFAKAEVVNDDPMTARKLTPEDKHDIAGFFTSPVER